MEKQIFPDRFDTRLVVTGENADTVRDFLNGLKKKHCSKTHSSVLEFIVMDYIKMTNPEATENTKKTTKTKK